ncbi:MAG TPA: hypothetical protein VKA60_01410 [Blastocatellia bacterium]|nr:hypothetical protein [Blastocatellia bacterium]
MTKRMPHRIAAAGLALAILAGVALADDKSYSQVVKHIKTNYRAKQQGFFGMMMLARFAVKLIKPAGVKNFKVTLLRELDYSGAPSPESPEFHTFLRSRIAPEWTPLMSYSAPRERQWTYVFSTQEKDDLKLLVVTVQKQDAVVVQTRFNPSKLVEFMNNPQIMGISLRDENSQRHPSSSPNADDNAPSIMPPASQLTRICLIGLH